MRYHRRIQLLAGASLDRVRHAEGRFGLAVTDAVGTGVELRVDRVLVAAGRRPNITDVGLDTVGLDPGAPAVDDRRADAGRERLWAIGDITGKGAFTHMSMYQADVALRDVLGRDGHPAEYHAVPRVTYTDPEVGSVGMTEERAREAASTSPSDAQRCRRRREAGSTGRAESGLVKLVEDRGAGHLVGATSVGPMGGEVLAMLATAVHARIPTATLQGHAAGVPHLHPRRGDGAGRPGGLNVAHGDRVEAAMAAHPREHFLPRAVRRQAGYDGPLDIGHGQTNSQPRTVHAMIQLLDVHPGHRVLDVGPARAGRRRSSPSSSDRTGPCSGSNGCATSCCRARPPWLPRGCRGPASGPPPRGCSVRRTRRRSTGSSSPPWRPGCRRSSSRSWRANGILVAPVRGQMLRVERDDASPEGRRMTAHGAYRFVPLVTD